MERGTVEMSGVGQTNYLKGHHIPMLGAPALHTNSVLVGAGHPAAPKVCNSPDSTWDTEWETVCHKAFPPPLPVHQDLEEVWILTKRHTPPLVGAGKTVLIPEDEHGLSQEIAPSKAEPDRLDT